MAAAPRIRLAPGAELPLEAVTQTFGVLGRKGSGKTYTAGVLAEGMLAAGAQVVVLDPVGNWWALRLDADGRSPGFGIPVLGGERGDGPLVPSAGAAVADALADTGSSAVLDVSGFRRPARREFVGAFAEQLLLRQKTRRSPMHLMIEEAHLVAPQRARGSEAMAAAVEDIVRLGRNYGIGVTLISQRPQSVDKECLNQAEALIVHQLAGPHERRAAAAWIADRGAAKDALAELPSLPPGTAFLWSPQWLGAFERIEVARKRTWDASATPVFGENGLRAAPIAAELRGSDLRALTAAAGPPSANGAGPDSGDAAGGAETAALRRRIDALERELAEARAAAAEARAMRERMLSAADRLGELADGIANAADDIAKAAGEDPAERDAPPPAKQPGPKRSAAPGRAQETNRAAKPAAGERAAAAPDGAPVPQAARHANGRGPGGMPVYRHALLRAIAQDPGASSRRVALLAGKGWQSSTFRGHVSALRGDGLADGGAAGLWPTAAGLDAVRGFAPLPDGDGLLDAWDARLARSGRNANVALLRAVRAAHPQPLRLDMVEEWTARDGGPGYSPDSSTVRGAASALRTIGLADGSLARGGLQLAAECGTGGA